MIPDAYPRLILDAIRGDQQHFVRRWAGRHSHRRRAANAVQCVPLARLAWCASTVCPGCLVPCCRGCCHRKAAARPPSAPTLADLPCRTNCAGMSCVLPGPSSRRCCMPWMRGACRCTPTHTAAGALSLPVHAYWQQLDPGQHKPSLAVACPPALGAAAGAQTDAHELLAALAAAAPA